MCVCVYQPVAGGDAGAGDRRAQRSKGVGTASHCGASTITLRACRALTYSSAVYFTRIIHSGCGPFTITPTHSPPLTAPTLTHTSCTQAEQKDRIGQQFLAAMSNTIWFNENFVYKYGEEYDIVCPYAHAGCACVCPRKDLEDHLKQCRC